MKLLWIFGLLLSAGCATLNKEECERANWQDLGQRDGRSGYTNARLTKHQEACSEHGISVNTTEYTRGYQNGLKSFCTKQNGFEQGKSGKTNQRVCPPKLQSLFNKGYTQGRRIYELNKGIEAAEKAIADLNSRIDETYSKEEFEKRSYASERRRLSRDKATQERKLRRLERELDILRTTSLIKSFLN